MAYPADPVEIRGTRKFRKFIVTAEVEVEVDADDEDEAALSAITMLNEEATIIMGAVLEVREVDESEVPYS